MAKPLFKPVVILLFVLVLFACNTQKQEELELSLSVNLDGKPATGVQVSIDGAAAGETDSQGQFISRLQRLPGQQVLVAIKSEKPGYRIDAWQQTFVTKLSQSGVVERYPFDIHLKSEKYFTLAVNAGGKPVEGVAIRIQDKSSGKTDANGEFTHSYQSMPPKGFSLTVQKKGYQTLKRRVKIMPGELIEVPLQKRTQAAPSKVSSTGAEATTSSKSRSSAARGKPIVTIAARYNAYGVSKPLPGVAVQINGKRMGKTDAKGNFAYRHSNSGKSARITLSAPGHIPATWETKVTLKGKRSVQRHFYPATPPAITVGMYGYINNSPESDLATALEQAESSLSANLFLYRSFKEVPKPQLHDMLLMHSLDMQTITTKGWEHTPMVKSVDMILSGSITKNADGFTIETTLTTADGKILLSQLNTARKERDIQRTSKIIAAGIVDQFPFEGTVAAVEPDGYQVNLGQRNYKIRRGNVFRYMAAQMNRNGLITGYREAGLLRVVKTEDAASWVEVARLKETQEIKVGDKVIRRVYLEEEREAAKSSFVLVASGGSQTSATPLWGVNVYLNNTWVGTTGANGKVEVPVHLHEAYDMLLSRHGYQPLRNTVSVSQNKSVQPYTLAMANARFKIESEPSGADVFVDGVQIGKTPMLDGTLVNFGFRKVRLTVGDDYRDWERVVEFNKPEVAYSGATKVRFLKDHYKIGQLAEQNGQTDQAIQSYGAIERQNPDYSDARHRLAQLYMDQKGDYANAINEFEKVLALPENQQIIYKQFAITYTNLGHAYYEQGTQLVWKDKAAAAQNFAKAVEKLKIAKQNTRFFPNNEFNQAVHDTYYYLAIANHKLYLVTKKSALLAHANQAWREYFDFFPKQLEGQDSFEKLRKAARQYWSQIKDLS